MKNNAILSLLFLSVCTWLSAAEPQAELLTEPLHRPIAADIEELPSDGKIGDFFNVRSVTDDAVTVQFGIRLPAETGVTVRLIQGEKTLAALSAPGRFGRILFSGLEPDTDYTVSAEYVLFSAEPEAVRINGLTGEKALASLTRVCRTLPAPKGELLLRAAFVSDTHVSVIEKPMGRLHCISREILADVCRDAAARECALMFIGGDVTNESLEKEFEMAKEAMAGFPGKILLVPGNHDIKKDEELVRWRAAFGAAACYDEEGGVQFVGLNTADGKLNKPENLEAIEKLDPARPAVIFSHFQLVKDEHLNDENKAIKDADLCAAQLEKIASSKSVIYVGHKNVAATARLGNVLQINMPQTTQFPMGWLEAEIRTDGIYQRFVFSSAADREELSRLLGGCYLGTIGYRDWRSAEIWNRFVPWPESEEK
ncbi:MAG: metallophosphoesterase [Thermoguttaceae bacterium]|nr:metallophosphoesterase [Thermoguttaceae bacterium]